MYEDGCGVDQNYSTAVEWYRKAAEHRYGNGAATAQFHLGRMYENELGVYQNYSTAVEWYRKAAERRYTDAAADAHFNLDRLTTSLRKRKKLN